MVKKLTKLTKYGFTHDDIRFLKTLNNKSIYSDIKKQITDGYTHDEIMNTCREHNPGYNPRHHPRHHPRHGNGDVVRALEPNQNLLKVSRSSMLQLTGWLGGIKTKKMQSKTKYKYKSKSKTKSKRGQIKN